MMEGDLESLAKSLGEDYSFPMGSSYGEMSDLDFLRKYKRFDSSYKPSLEMPDNIMDDGCEDTSVLKLPDLILDDGCEGTSVNFSAFPGLIGNNLSMLENDNEGQFKIEDDKLDSIIIKDTFLSFCNNEDALSDGKLEIPSEVPYYGTTEQLVGLDGLEQLLLDSGDNNEYHDFWKLQDRDCNFVVNSPKKNLTSTNSRSLLRSNVNSENTLPEPLGLGSSPYLHSGLATPVTSSSTRFNLSNVRDDAGFIVGLPCDIPDQERISSGTECSDSDAMETSRDSIWGDNGITMMATNDLMTPENSDVDTKIRYTSHDHTYSHPTQDKIQPLNKNGSYLTPSETDDSEIDVESVSTDHLTKSWRQQFDESRQQLLGYRRTAVRTLLPVNKNSKKPKAPVNYEVNKSPAISRSRSHTRPTPYNKTTAKRPTRSKRSDHLTLEQQEARRLRHNAAERQRRHIQRDLLQELNGAVPASYMPKGRMSQQNVMKGAAECLKDFKLQHEQVGFEFAQTTIFDELHDIREIIKRVCSAD